MRETITYSVMKEVGVPLNSINYAMTGNILDYENKEHGQLSFSLICICLTPFENKMHEARY